MERHRLPRHMPTLVGESAVVSSGVDSALSHVFGCVCGDTAPGAHSGEGHSELWKTSAQQASRPIISNYAKPWAQCCSMRDFRMLRDDRRIMNSVACCSMLFSVLCPGSFTILVSPLWPDSDTTSLARPPSQLSVFPSGTNLARCCIFWNMCASIVRLSCSLIPLSRA